MASSSTCLLYEGHAAPRLLTDPTVISEALKEPGAFVWYDVVAPFPDDLALIQEEFDLHPLAIEDAVKAHQRSKIESYDSSWFLVVHGVTHRGNDLFVHEVAIFVGKHYVVTVRATPAYPLDEVTRRWDHLPESLERDSGVLLYTILDTLVDGYWPAAEHLEERVNELETTLLTETWRTREALLQIFGMKKHISRFRKAVYPMREILTALMRNEVGIIHTDEMPYFRDIYDHVTRVIEEVDAGRDLVNSALEIHLGITSNQQNEVAKQLTIIATIFLPLTYLTGFFGQNFGFLVNGITGERSFWWLGVGLEVVAAIALLIFFKRKRWM